MSRTLLPSQSLCDVHGRRGGAVGLTEVAQSKMYIYATRRIVAVSYAGQVFHSLCGQELHFLYGTNR